MSSQHFIIILLYTTTLFLCNFRFSFGYKIDITSHCDDYCTPSKNNKKNTKQTFTYDFNLNAKTFEIILRNDEGEFGLALELSFGFFKYTTNDITNWQFGKTGEACADIQPQLVDKNYFSKFALIVNNGGILNYKSCTITLPRICKNENYYMPKNQQNFKLDVFNFLNVSPQTKKVLYITFITVPIKGKLKKDNILSSKDIKNGDTMSEHQTIHYNKINEFYTDPIEFHLRENSKGTIFDTCSFNIVICGEHCIKCADNVAQYDYKNEPICSQCQTNFAMKVDDLVNCHDIKNELKGYYYDKTTDKFELCYETCQTCSSGGNELYNKCDECKTKVGDKNILSKVEVKEGKDKVSYNCGFSTCGELGMYTKESSTIECVSNCDENEYIFESKCLKTCPHKTYEKKLKDDLTKTIKMCVENCREHSAYLVESEKKCVSECAKYVVIGNDETKCEESCDKVIYESNNQMFCAKDCSGYNFISISNSTCVDNCEANEFQMDSLQLGDTSIKACVTKCSPPYIYQYSSGTLKKCLTECPTEAPFINTVDNTCVIEEICKEQSLYIYETEHECYKSCPKHLFSKEEEKNGIKSKLCKDSCDDNEYKHTESKQCFSDNCPEQYPLKDVDSHECVLFCGDKFQTVPGNECVAREECLETYEFIDDDNKLCLNTCQENPFDTHRLSEGSKCVSKCSEFTSPNDKGRCSHELYVVETSETTGVITIPFDQTLIWVDKYVTEYNDLHLHITGDGFNMQVFSTKEPLSENNKITYCDLDECINKIKEKEKIPEHETLYIAKFDIIDNNHTIDQVQYKIYNKNGKQLSMDVCDGLSTTVTYPFKEILIGDVTEDEEEENEISINFELALAMFSKHDINIYDSSDPFFNDICFIYKNENGSEMTLQDRRIKYYQNFTFCEDNCVYKSLDFENLTAKCDCKIKTQFTDSLQEWSSVQENNEPFVSEDFSTQYLMYKCYKLFFKFDYLHYNIGFWSGVILIFFEILFIILLPCLELKIMRSRLNSYKEQKEKANPPIKPKKKNKVTFNNDKLNLNSDCKTTQTLFNKIQTYSESDPYENYYFNSNASSVERNLKLNRLQFQLDNKGSQEHSNSMRELDFYNYICFNENKIIDDYPFQIGKLIDRRSFCKVYFDKLLQHNLFVCVFSNKSLHDFVSIKLSLVFTDISLSLGLCCLFYSEQIITDKYLYNKVDILCRPLRFVFSVLIEYTVIKLIKYIHVSSFIFEYILYEIHNWFFLGEFIKKILCRISSYATFLFIIELVFSLTIWLYMTLFCIIYSNSQMHWFISGWVNLAFTYGVSVCFIFILALFRFISVKYKSQTLYNIELKLRMLV